MGRSINPLNKKDMSQKKYYEVCLCRIAWYMVKAENATEAEKIAQENGELDDYSEDEGRPYYVTEEVDQNKAKNYDKVFEKSYE